MKENQYIASQILHIYADYQKRPGAYKITYVLKRDYGINISVGRVYRLMKQLQLPKMSTDKPSKSHQRSDNEKCYNHLQQNFNQPPPPPILFGSVILPILRLVGNGIICVLSWICTLGKSFYGIFLPMQIQNLL